MPAPSLPSRYPCPYPLPVRLLKNHVQGIKTLAYQAFRSPSATTSQHAMRVLANALLNCAPCRQFLIDLSYGQQAVGAYAGEQQICPQVSLCKKLVPESYTDEFLASRLLFLMAYDSSMDLTRLIGGACNVVTRISAVVEDHARLACRRRSVFEALSWGSRVPAGTAIASDQVLALNETVKLVYVLSFYIDSTTLNLSCIVSPLIKILCRMEMPQPKPLDLPFKYVVNALTSLEVKRDTDSLFPRDDEQRFIKRLIRILDIAVAVYKDHELEYSAPPLVTLLRDVVEVAPPEVHALARTELLPSPKPAPAPKKIFGFRAQTPSRTLPSRLADLARNHNTPRFRTAVFELLFAISNKEARQFVETIGSGFASYFACEKSMDIPNSAAEAFSSGAAATDEAKDIDEDLVESVSYDAASPLLATDGKSPMSEKAAERTYAGYQLDGDSYVAKEEDKKEPESSVSTPHLKMLTMVEKPSTRQEILWATETCCRLGEGGDGFAADGVACPVPTRPVEVLMDKESKWDNFQGEMGSGDGRRVEDFVQEGCGDEVNFMSDTPGPVEGLMHDVPVHRGAGDVNYNHFNDFKQELRESQPLQELQESLVSLRQEHSLEPATLIGSMPPEPDMDCKRLSFESATSIDSIPPEPNIDCKQLSLEPATSIKELQESLDSLKQHSLEPATLIGSMPPEPDIDCKQLSFESASIDCNQLSFKPATSIHSIPPEPDTYVKQLSLEPATSIDSNPCSTSTFSTLCTEMYPRKRLEPADKFKEPPVSISSLKQKARAKVASARSSPIVSCSLERSDSPFSQSPVSSLTMPALRAALSRLGHLATLYNLWISVLSTLQAQADYFQQLMGDTRTWSAV